MNLGVVGSRTWDNQAMLESYLERFCRRREVVRVVSGGAAGADTMAADWARRRGLLVVEHLPDYSLNGSSAPFVRNWQIVADSDELIAFWDGQSRGTRHSLDVAQRMGKPTWVIYPDATYARFGKEPTHPSVSLQGATYIRLSHDPWAHRLACEEGGYVRTVCGIMRPRFQRIPVWKYVEPSRVCPECLAVKAGQAQTQMTELIEQGR